MTASALLLTPDRIRATHAAIAPHVRRTPAIEVAGEDFGLPGVQLVFKLEFLQHAGSFKARGAFAHMLTRDIPAAGVVAASGGNHGAATAFAAMRTGRPAAIFVPRVASPAKLAQIRAYGAQLHVVGERYADALAASQDHVARTGTAAVHAYDQAETLLGQGTVALEFEQQAPGLDAVLVAVGGGGLVGGMAAWFAGRVPLVAVEPERAPTLHAALEAGEPVDVAVDGIAADSLGARRIGELMFPIARQHVTTSVLVPDAAIAAAQQALWERLRIVAEPGGAAAMAALLCGAWRPRAGQRIGVLLCGANTTAVQFAPPAAA